MSDTDTQHIDDALELARLMRPTWPGISAGIAATGVPTCEGDDDDDPDDKGGDDTPPAKTPEQLAADVEKWKALARKHEKAARTNAGAADKLAELEDADKTETERLNGKLVDAEKRATSAESKLTRMEVALDKAPEGLSLAKVRKLAGRLTGDSREDLEADAEDLFADFAPDTGDEDDDDRTTSRTRPRERLRNGSTPTSEPEETNPDKLAASVPRVY